ncbi:helix-turn-helix domain-containing protein [Methylobacterium sp. Leaf85]|uniref:helix-turn-helix domain-containing protein n=1 Tax=Methylobacterium sp. Leaf85 TaxID=1736241 RepID=UPI0012E72AE3
MSLLPDDRSWADPRQTGWHHRAACHDPRRREGWRRPDYPICAIGDLAELFSVSRSTVYRVLARQPISSG